MHTSIKIGKSLHRILYYHERKVKEGVAECLYAGNMVKEAQELKLKEKQFFLQRLDSLNERVTRRTMSLILSCHQNDRIDNEQMRRLGREYVREMGLEGQPFLIYRHRDTPHPHLHIVTSRIRPDGSEFKLSPGMYLRSLKLSREVEVKYGLYQAGRRLTEKEYQAQYPVQVIRHGETPLKPTINAILGAILPSHVYTSLDELNVLIRPYRLMATRGSEDSITYRRNGLLYVPLNSQGEMEEVYVKSSLLRMKPGLRYLRQRFAENQPRQAQMLKRVTTSIDWIFHNQQVSMRGLQERLREDKIDMIVTPQQKIYFVDRLNKAVFSGIAGIQDRCISEEAYQRQQQEQKLVQGQRQKLKQRPGMDLI
jgi:hypothetical protein